MTIIVIPDSVTSIVQYTFAGCSSLTSIVIPDSVTTIGEYAFYGCTSLTSIVIPDSVTSIGSYAFEDCSSLTSVTIGNGVTSIGTSAFHGCSSLESITLPFVGANASATSASNSTLFGYIFGDDSYEGSYGARQHYGSSSSSVYYIPSSLKSVTITGGNILNGAFYNCTSLTSIVIGNSVKSIRFEAFYGCSSLTSVTIGNSVTSIRDRAF